MTPEEFKTQYLDLDDKLEVQNQIKRIVCKRIDDLTARQAELATLHLEELTELRAGQVIELASKAENGLWDWKLPTTTLYLTNIMSADVADPDPAFFDQDMALDPDLRAIEITVWATDESEHVDDGTKSLQPHPGNQWRYPEASKISTCESSQVGQSAKEVA